MSLDIDKLMLSSLKTLSPILKTTSQDETKLQEKIETKKSLKICCITWNMHGLTPTNADLQLLFNQYKDYDLYVIGTQECLRSILQSFFYSDKTIWENLLEEYFGKEYMLIQTQNMSAIHISVVMKRQYLSAITNIESDFVRAGIGNMVGNKGGVAICFKFMGISMLFISSHLAAGKENQLKRNEDFDYIHSNLFLDKGINVYQFDFTVFMGDMNYRLETSYELIKNQLVNKEYASLFKYDQLSIEKNSNRLKLLTYKEAPIHFPPTFKYYDNSNELCIDKDDHIPAWTDRILFKCQRVSNTFYDVLYTYYNSVPDVNMSDHKPVIGLFELELMH